MQCPRCKGKALKNGIAPGHRQAFICKECGHGWREPKRKKEQNND